MTERLQDGGRVCDDCFDVWKGLCPFSCPIVRATDAELMDRPRPTLDQLSVEASGIRAGELFGLAWKDVR